MNEESNKQSKMLIVVALLVVAVAVALWSATRFLNTGPRVVGTLGEEPAAGARAVPPGAGAPVESRRGQ